MELAIAEYLKFERDQAYRSQVENCRDEAELRKMFGKRIAFGTAGLRGNMKAGISGMNCGSVWRASQGLCQYWIDQLGLDECMKRGAVVGFDGRHNSEYLASVTAAVFMSKNIPVYFADEVTATPITPFCVVKYKAFCGVQVTASHNPKIDNGYKVYSENGAQIIPPQDADIAKHIELQNEPWLEVDEIVDHQLRRLNPISPKRQLAKFVLPEAWSSFKTDAMAELNLTPGCLKESSLKVVYTAMHGVGFRYVNDLLVNCLGFPTTQWYPVSEQQYPDPEFSTVKFPNPEEAGALDLAKSRARECNADLIIANDPDADRFAACERQADGSWRQFTGDELGAIFGMIAYENWEQKHRENPSTKGSFVCSAVSATFLKRYAEKRRIEFRETLTGFKWMVNISLKMKKEENILPCFCYEEALGYGLCVETIPDKCGLTAAASFVKKATELKKLNGQTMGQWLNQEMQNHGGYFATENSYYVASDPTVTKKVMAGFRERFGGSLTTPFLLGGYEVCRIRDLAQNYDSSTEDHKCTLPPIDEMLTVEFKNGSRITLRGSGTEPKLKYYSEMLSNVSLEDAKENLAKEVRVVVKEILGTNELKHSSEL